MIIPKDILENKQYRWKTIYVNDIEHLTLDDSIQRNLFWLEVWAYALTQKHNMHAIKNEIIETSPVYVNSKTNEVLDDGITSFTAQFSIPPIIINLSSIVILIGYILLVIITFITSRFVKPSLVGLGTLSS